MFYMITVITPTYNGISKGLNRSINSVLQIDTVQEYIIIVDGSNDSSYELCKELKKRDKRIKLILNNTNMGWTYSVSKAIDQISNKWITIHNDDDWLLPTFFSGVRNQTLKTAPSLSQNVPISDLERLAAYHAQASE